MVSPFFFFFFFIILIERPLRSRQLRMHEYSSRIRFSISLVVIGCCLTNIAFDDNRNGNIDDEAIEKRILLIYDRVTRTFVPKSSF